MGFAWKFLLPLVLVNILSAALWLTVRKWGSDPNWTVMIAPLGSNLLGWLETAPSWLRELIGWVLTAIINGASFLWILRVNRRPAGETPAELAQDQAFGVASLP